MVKNVFLLLAIVLSSACFAPASASVTPSNGEVPCLNCPPTNDFHVAEIAPTFMRLAWTQPPTAIGVQLKVTKLTGNTVVFNNVIPPNEVQQVIYTELGATYECVLRTICAGGLMGPPEVLRPDGVVVDIPLQIQERLFNPVYNNPIDGIATVQWGSGLRYWVDVFSPSNQGEKVARYTISPDALNHIDVATICQPSNSWPSTYGTYSLASGGWIPSPADNVPNVVIRNPENADVFKFQLSILNGNLLKITGTPVAPNGNGYTYKVITNCNLTYEPCSTGGEGNGAGKRSDDNNDSSPSEVSNNPTVSPNPFSETLDIITPLPTDGPVTLQLFNINGRMVLEQRHNTGSDRFTLETASLASGFYLLRVETNGTVKTFKVVKSE